jgi:2-polyprenyl-3-methyl-5-hydroxy-6-metoxy-1,4-benzoquinol methylase
VTVRHPTAADEVRFASPSGEIVYADSRDHFENALLRLMRMSREEFDRWLALAEEEPDGPLLERLGRGLTRLRPVETRAIDPDAPVDAGPDGTPGELWHAALAETPEVGMARSHNRTLSWLVRPGSSRHVREMEPPVYEEQYFEGDPAVAGGYGDYAEQAGWRLEKAERQVRELRSITGLQEGRVLDVGSGYGYFRKALGDAGFDHDGIEISAFARDAARRLFGFETDGGTLEDRAGGWEGRYDAITLWDLIEHLADPVGFMELVGRCLRPGGFVGVKTPSITCPEADHLGPHYHSLKREHLVLLSPASLERVAAAAGFETANVATPSHLLQGFCGREELDRWEAERRGADVVAYFRRS